jgi:hypothetical protein
VGLKSSHVYEINIESKKAKLITRSVLKKAANAIQTPNSSHTLSAATTKKSGRAPLILAYPDLYLEVMMDGSHVGIVLLKHRYKR